MIEMLWWYWIVLAFGFILAELLVPAFVLVWFGLGGFLVGGAFFLAPSLSLAAQLLLWTVSSLVMMALWFKVFKRGRHKVLVGRASAALVGEVGIVVETVAPFKAGKVRFQKPVVGSDVWSCMAQEEIGVGARARVESVEGNAVVVKKLEG